MNVVPYLIPLMLLLLLAVRLWGTLRRLSPSKSPRTSGETHRESQPS